MNGPNGLHVKYSGGILLICPLLLCVSVLIGADPVLTPTRGVTFHDGSALTAHDVQYTYTRLLDPDARNITGGQFDYTFVLHLKFPFSGVLYTLNKYVLPEPLGGDAEAAPLVGTGPYRFVSRNDSEIFLEGYEAYHHGRPSISSVVFRYFPSPKAAWSALLRGEADIVVDLSASDYELVRDNPKFTVYEHPLPFYYTFLFNNEDPILRDRGLREAIDAAVDRKDLIHVALNDLATIARGPFNPTSEVHGAVEASDLGGNIRTARNMLDESGWIDTDHDGVREKEGRELSLELIIDESDPLKERIARRLQWQLLQVGISLRVKTYPVAELISGRLIPGDYQLSV